MKKFTLLAICCFCFGLAFGQQEISEFNATGGAYSATFVTDYQCLGINAANLGWRKRESKMSLGLLQTGLSVYSEALTRKQVLGDMFDESISLSFAEKKLAAEDFTEKRIWAQVAATWLGFAYQDDKIGGIAFSIRDRLMWNSVLNAAGASFLFLGYDDPYFEKQLENGDTVGYAIDPKNASTVYRGTDQDFIWYREFNLGYGRKLIENSVLSLYAGINLKYLVGYAATQYDQTGGELIGFSALSPLFEVDFDTPTPSAIEGSGMKKTGTGTGFDLGVTAILMEKIKVGVAVNDIGSITWDGNVYQGNETSVWMIETPGIDDYNIFAQGQLISSDSKPGDPELWSGLDEKKVNLPANLRVGSSYQVNEMLEAGFDVLLPLQLNVPGQYESALFGVGCHLDPAPWVQLSAGVSGGGEIGTRIPLGVSLYPVKTDETTWEIGFGVRDFLSLFKQENSTVSLSAGFLRFKF